MSEIPSDDFPPAAVDHIYQICLPRCGPRPDLSHVRLTDLIRFRGFDAAALLPQALPLLPVPLHPSSDRKDSERSWCQRVSDTFPPLMPSCAICHFSSGLDPCRDSCP